MKRAVNLLHRIRTAIKLVLTGKWKDFWHKFKQAAWNMKMYLGGMDLSRSTLLNAGKSSRQCVSPITPGPDLEKTLCQMNIPADARILDIGCGKGAALITFTKFPFARIAGCDIESELIRIAGENMKKRDLTTVELFCSDATTFRDLDDFNYLYFFNPFTPEIFRAVMQNVYASLKRNPRDITIIYRNPVSHEAIICDGVFHKERELHYGMHPFYIYRNRPLRNQSVE